MVIQIQYLELLPKEYKKAVKNLLKKLQNANQFTVKYRNLQAFVEKYTGLPEIFDYWYRETINNDIDQRNKNIKWHGGMIYERSLIDFPQHKAKEWPDFDQNLRNNLSSREDTIKFFLILPHSKLSVVYQIFLEEYDNQGSTGITQKYKNACKIYEEMQSTDINDGEKYIKILKKTKNEEFVIKNIECQLSKNPWCQNLWIAYIHFLEVEKKDFKALLSVLQRYCRFFISDKKMIEKYQSKIEEMSQIFGGILEFWIDSIKFELQFSSVNSAITLLNKALKSKMYEILKFFDVAMDLVEQFRHPKMAEMIEEARKIYLNEHPDTDDYSFKKVVKNLSFNDRTKMQKFPFSKSINRYLYDKIDYQHLQKLYQTCKWFYYKYRLNLVHRLEILPQSVYYISNNQYLSAWIPYEKYSNSSIILSPFYNDLKKLKNLWLTHSLSVSDGDYIPQAIKMATKISLKYLYISFVVFTFHEFMILTESKTIKKLHFWGVRIDKDDNTIMCIEDILEDMPKLEFISFIGNGFLQQPSNKLLSLKFDNKIKYLNLQHLQNLDIETLFLFLQKNLAPNANLCFYNIILTNYQEIRRQIITKINDWKPEIEKPQLSWSYNHNV